jgi:hypothetical protein
VVVSLCNPSNPRGIVRMEVQDQSWAKVQDPIQKITK